MVRVRYSFGSRHTGKIENIKKQREKYPNVAKEVIRISDILLEILDSRFIDDTRNEEMEESIKSKGKKIIYVLNKSDLVDVKEIQKNLPKNMRPFVFVSAKSGAGAKDLRDRIKIEAKRVELNETMTRVHVGIIGYPNTGKSSIINLITRRGVAKTSKQAGFTKGVQKIRFSEDILILDTPGVIPESRYSSDKNLNRSYDAKVGARTYSDVKDPEEVVDYLMSEKQNQEKIESFYNIKSDGDSEILINELGKSKGFLSKGAVIDVDRTARLILRDWQEGKISKQTPN